MALLCSGHQIAKPRNGRKLVPAFGARTALPDCIRVAGRVSDTMPVPAEEKLSWFVSNVGSSWRVPGRKGDLISPCAFVSFKKVKKFPHHVLQPQRPGPRATQTSENVSPAANDQFRISPGRSKAKLTVTRSPAAPLKGGSRKPLLMSLPPQPEQTWPLRVLGLEEAWTPVSQVCASPTAGSAGRGRNQG